MSRASIVLDERGGWMVQFFACERMISSAYGSALRAVFVLLLLIAVSVASARDTPPDSSNLSQPMVLRVESGRVSVDARDVSLVELIRQIGQVLKFAVDSRLPEVERVTAKFDDLPPEQALDRLSANHTLIRDEKTGRIARVILLPGGFSGRAAPQDAAGDDSPAPFEFSFDPAEIKERPGK